ILWDERLTTVAADRAMDEVGIKTSEHKKYVDEIAAMFILQGYLDRLRISKESYGKDQF
ncbi:MAG: Holliday junction resolvase RuvX, partial [Lachnospiraceae bacterium]|nr:Holliday junction resolvase RuvX [Lachnospiraceae bacterium]